MNAIKAEVIKLASLRSTILYTVLLTGSLYGPQVLSAVFAGEDSVETWGSIFTTSSFIFAIIAAVFSASSVGGDISSGLNAHAFLTQQKRWQWLCAKAVTGFTFLTLNLLLGVALSLLVIWIAPNVRFADRGYGEALAAILPIVLMWAASFGFSALFRSLVSGMTITLVYYMVIESLLFTAAVYIEALHPLAKVLAIPRTQDIAAYVDNFAAVEPGWSVDSPAPLWYNIVVLAAYIVIPLVLGLIRNQKSDVK
ncbi:ABC transporter permease subunit [Canibacter zhoujuaniae]|nr:ABC transporter permease subunit [Canibacter zhoujuaniae]